jgi:hypothetical protein
MRNNNISKTPKNQRLSFKFFFSLLFISLLAWQCVSPPDYLGGDLIPDQDKFNVKYDTTFVLSGYTVPYDTVITMMFQDAILGETFDPVFGRTKSSFVTQILPSVNAHKYGTEVTVDSAFLVLRLRSKFGNEPINVGVYQLTDSLHYDSIYNALIPIDQLYSDIQIGNTFDGPYSGDKNQIKIKLDNDWVLNTLVGADSASMATIANFTKHLYGLYVKTTGDFGAYAKGMYSFDYISTESRVAVYYKNAEMTQDTASLVFAYVLDHRCRRFINFQHDYSVADPGLKMSFNPPTNTQDSVFYVKGLGGSRGLIKLDDIFNWQDKMPVAINKAELRIELEQRDGLPRDSIISQMLFYQIKDYQKVGIIDYSINESVFGGFYRRSKNYYSFNITYHLQNLLKNPDPDLTLYIEPKDFSKISNGAVLRSGSHTGRMKLLITYTKL